MHIHRIHVGQVALARVLVVGSQQTTRSDESSGTRHVYRAQRTIWCGPLQRVVRWLNRPTIEHAAHPPVREPTTWPECLGHPYVIGAGTFLVMTYLRARLPRLDGQSPTSISAHD